MNWSKWKTKIQSIDVSSTITSIKDSASVSSAAAVSFVRNISSSEPQQFIEAEQLGIYYITSNVLAMGFPSQESLFSATSNATLSKLGKFVSDSLANKISFYLNKYHDGRYMIWNLSEKTYATKIFNDQVIEFRFPGYPSPPLQQLFELLSCLDNWLSSNNENVAIIHCQTGKGRTVCVISAYLAWSKYHNMTPAKALLHCVKMMNGTIKNMTIPSQTRYLAYLTKILINKQTPKQNPLVIQRVIVHKIPIFEINEQTYYVKKKKREIENDTKSASLLNMDNNEHKKEAQFMIGSIDDEQDDDDDDDNNELGQNINIEAMNDDENNDEIEHIQKEKEKEEKDTEKKENLDKIEEEETEKKIVKKSGVRAYIQIFKNAKLIFSSRRKNSTLKFYDASEEHIKFEVNQAISGDVLVRIRHLCNNGRNKISVCRFAFNTGYLDSNRVIRFKKTQLDGAWNSNKFNKDFWIDLLIGNEIEIDAKQRAQNDAFWDNINKQFGASALSLIEEKNRFSLVDIAEISENAYDDNEWKHLLTQWNLKEYIAKFEKEELFRVEEWKNLTKDDLINIGLTHVDAEIFLNFNDNPQNVANQNKNDIDEIQNKINRNDENYKHILNEMNHSEKEMMENMTFNKEDIKQDNNNAHIVHDDDDVLTKNAEEEEAEIIIMDDDEEEEKKLTTTSSSLENTFGDLEQFADGLDLDNVQVDSDTEQNFEMLLEELNDDNQDNIEKEKSNSNLDLP